MMRLVPSGRRAAIPVLTLFLCLVTQGLSLEGRELGERTTKGNKTVECSPSGLCVTCSYSEKSDVKYHCSETGYHMPYKCVEVHSDNKVVNKEQDATQAGLTNSYNDEQLQNHQSQQMDDQIDDTENKDGNWRKLTETSYTLEDGKQTYHIFGSCVPPADEEKLSVLGFEDSDFYHRACQFLSILTGGIILCLLLISSPVVYYRKKRNFVMPGATRAPTTREFKFFSSR